LIERDLSNLDILTRIKKFEAALAYLLDDAANIRQINKTFINQATAYSTDDEDQHVVKKNHFIKYLEHDIEK
jgi:hypothetical protein